MNGRTACRTSLSFAKSSTVRCFKGGCGRRLKRKPPCNDCSKNVCKKLGLSPESVTVRFTHNTCGSTGFKNASVVHLPDVKHVGTSVFE